MRHVLIGAVLTAMCLATHSTVSAADAPQAGNIDYAYFEGDADHLDRQRIIVIGSHLSKKTDPMSNCQTRTKIAGNPSPWHDALEISRATEDEYKFKPTDNSASADVVEVQVVGEDGKYTNSVTVGDCSDYRDHFFTFGSPHDALGKSVQVKWCPDPKPQLGAKICPDTKHALVCQNKNDFVVVGVHFAAGTVTQVKISFDYTQWDKNLPGGSDSVLKRAVVTDDANCPPASAFRDVQQLDQVYNVATIKCFPASDSVVPGPKDVAVYYMIKRKTWPTVLNVNEVHIETTMTQVNGGAKAK